MRSDQRKIMNQVNASYELGLTEIEYEYSRFDAKNGSYVVEIKDRNTFYKETLIEFDKYAFNKEYAKINNKEFLYVIGMNNEIYLFNVSDLDNNGFDYHWHWRKMPRHTEFDDKEDIYKFVGYIDTERVVGRISLDD